MAEEAEAQDLNQEIISLYLKFSTDFSSESDRGAAVIAGAVFDDMLKEMLARRMVESTISRDLLREGGPLGSFSTRIDAAFALGIISSGERECCHIIRRIRNDFAHRIEFDFETRSIADRCRALSSILTGAEHDKAPPGQRHVSYLTHPSQNWELCS